MKILDIVRVVVYRCQEKGLEVLLVNSEIYNNPYLWKIPSVELKKLHLCEDCIELDPFVDKEGSIHYTIAVPSNTISLTSVPEDQNHHGHEGKVFIPKFEKGTFFSVKEAIKYALPSEYRALNELKDVLFDRNLVRYI